MKLARALSFILLAAVVISIVPPVVSADDSLIRTPPAPDTPRINGARVFGAHPGHPFFFHIPVTGKHPIMLAAEGLPAGLTLDAATGNITGTTSDAGPHKIAITATNALGFDKSTLNIVIGDTICLTPPMGFNSWNHFAHRVSDKIMRDTADTMVATGLIDHGWTFVNIDDCWEGTRDAKGAILGNERFPDMKALGDYIHSKGLKFGIYSSPGPKTCAKFEATYKHEDQDAQTYADWGVDYVKYDWCTYGQIAKKITAEKYADALGDLQDAKLFIERDQLSAQHSHTVAEGARINQLNKQIKALTATIPAEKKKQIDLEILQHPYKQFGESIAKCSRDIVFSYCQYGMGDSWEWAGKLGGNCWRTTGDISANWNSMTNRGFSQNGHEKYASPGHWNDPDMLEIGNKGLTPDECYTHMTLWCMLSAPLLIGCDMTKMDEVTTSIFSNDEVIAVDQDELGKQGYSLKQEGTSEVWIKPLANGMAVALFNRGEQPATITVPTGDLHLDGAQPIRDLWRQKDIPAAAQISSTVAPHSAELFRVGGH